MYFLPQSIINPRSLYSGESVAVPRGSARSGCCSDSCSKVRVAQKAPVGVAAVRVMVVADLHTVSFFTQGLAVLFERQDNVARLGVTFGNGELSAEHLLIIGGKRVSYLQEFGIFHYNASRGSGCAFGTVPRLEFGNNKGFRIDSGQGRGVCQQEHGCANE